MSQEYAALSKGTREIRVILYAKADRDIAFDGAEAIVGPVIIAMMLLPYLVPEPLVRQIRAEGERARGF